MVVEEDARLLWALSTHHLRICIAVGAAEHNGWLGRSKGPSGLAARGHLCEGIAPREYSSFGAMHRLLEALSRSAARPLGHRRAIERKACFAGLVRFLPIPGQSTVRPYVKPSARDFALMLQNSNGA